MTAKRRFKPPLPRSVARIEASTFGLFFREQHGFQMALFAGHSTFPGFLGCKKNKDLVVVVVVAVVEVAEVGIFSSDHY